MKSDSKYKRFFPNPFPKQNTFNVDSENLGPPLLDDPNGMDLRAFHKNFPSGSCDQSCGISFDEK
jgi:hypothetical protein